MTHEAELLRGFWFPQPPGGKEGGTELCGAQPANRCDATQNTGEGAAASLGNGGLVLDWAKPWDFWGLAGLMEEPCAH